jgi:hypothetical protein
VNRHDEGDDHQERNDVERRVREKGQHCQGVPS